MNESRSFPVTEILMRVQAHFVSNFRVRRHFRRAFAPRPIFRFGDKPSADSVSAIFGFDKPAFENKLSNLLCSVSLSNPLILAKVAEYAISIEIAWP